MSDTLALVQQIEALTEEDGDNTAFYLQHITHAAPEVREAAVWALWNGDLGLILEPLLARMEKDEDVGVRGAAVSVLGRFIYEGLMPGALEKGAPHLKAIKKADTVLRGLLRNTGGLEVLRRRALESLAFDADAEVEAAIKEWSGSPNEQLRKSAAFAMGRADGEGFARILLQLLEDPSAIVQFEAIRSVGDQGLKKAVPKLVALAKGDAEELALEAIRALGLIGGQKAESTLEALTRGDSARAKVAREALAELQGED